MSLKITEEQAEHLIYECEPGQYDPEWDEFEVVYKDDWHGNGKFQTMNVIFKLPTDSQLYRLVAHRTGSHYTDWHREYQLQCNKVERKEVVTYEYVDCDPS